VIGHHVTVVPHDSYDYSYEYSYDYSYDYSFDFGYKITVSIKLGNSYN